jgi:hypothetical protein
MVIDEKLIRGFENQIKVLTNLSDKAQSALKKASDQYQLVRMPANFGKNIEDVVGPMQQRPGAQSRDGKDQKGHR